jgi:hypothetical protein
MRLILVLVIAASITTSVVGQTSGDSCPVQIGRVELLPARHLYHPRPASALDYNQERVLKIRYRNVAPNDISGGEMEVVTSLYLSGPTRTKVTHGQLVIPFASTVRAGQEKTLKKKVLTSAIPSQTWVRTITFVDGSQWHAKDASQCAYTIKPGDVGVRTAPVMHW